MFCITGFPVLPSYKKGSLLIRGKETSDPGKRGYETFKAGLGHEPGAAPQMRQEAPAYHPVPPQAPHSVSAASERAGYQRLASSPVTQNVYHFLLIIKETCSLLKHVYNMTTVRKRDQNPPPSAPWMPRFPVQPLGTFQ